MLTEVSVPLVLQLFVPKKHTEAYFNYNLVGLLAEASH